MATAQFLFEHAVVTGSPPSDSRIRLKDRLDSSTVTHFEITLPGDTQARVNLDRLVAVGLPHASNNADPIRWGSRYPQPVRLGAGPYVIEGTAHLWPGLGLDAWLLDEGRFVSLTQARARRDTTSIDYGAIFVARSFIAYVIADDLSPGDAPGEGPA